jgi:hypothetical protein
MDYREFMSYAPKGCGPTVITRQSILEDKVKELHKKVDDLTPEEQKQAFDDYLKATSSPYDLASD